MARGVALCSGAWEQQRGRTQPCRTPEAWHWGRGDALSRGQHPAPAAPFLCPQWFLLLLTNLVLVTFGGSQVSVAGLPLAAGSSAALSGHPHPAQPPWLAQHHCCLHSGSAQALLRLCSVLSAHTPSGGTPRWALAAPVVLRPQLLGCAICGQSARGQVAAGLRINPLTLPLPVLSDTGVRRNFWADPDVFS